MASPLSHVTNPASAEVPMIERPAEEERLLDEAEAEIARLGTIPAAEIRAWVESWGTPSRLPAPEPRK